MAYAYQAVIKSKIKAWPEAKVLCEKALNISPDSYAIRAAYAETLRQTGNLLAATGQISTAYKIKEAQQNYEKELLGDTYLE
jgi:predicted Zn-dependent protease